MAAPPSSLLLLSTLLLLLPAALSQSAPAPAPSGPINITAILSRENQYTFFIRLLVDTHSDDQINNQINNSRDGMTIFAPTDNAFNNLPSGTTLNDLSDQQHVQLVQYHILPKFYTLEDFRSVSNPVRTQAAGQGHVFGLNITAIANQVNVSTGIVQVPIYNAVRKDRPLAIYQVDKVLLPKEFSEAPPPESSPPAPPSGGSSSRRGGGGGSAAAAPASGNPGNGAGQMSVDLGMVSMIGLFVMGLLI